MKKTTILRTVTATAIAAMCLCTSVFAAGNVTSVKSTSTFVNDGGYVGTAVFGGSNTTAVNNQGDDNGTIVEYENILVNKDGYMGTVVKMPERTTFVTNIGNGNLTSVQEKSETYNLGGIIGNYIDISKNYVDICNQ